MSCKFKGKNICHVESSSPIFSAHEVMIAMRRHQSTLGDGMTIECDKSLTSIDRNFIFDHVLDFSLNQSNNYKLAFSSQKEGTIRATLMWKTIVLVVDLKELNEKNIKNLITVVKSKLAK
jgi:hypothetical protein